MRLETNTELKERIKHLKLTGQLQPAVCPIFKPSNYEEQLDFISMIPSVTRQLVFEEGD